MIKSWKFYNRDNNKEANGTDNCDEEQVTNKVTDRYSHAKVLLLECWVGSCLRKRLSVIDFGFVVIEW